MTWKRLQQALGLDGLVNRGVVPGRPGPSDREQIIALIQQRIDEIDQTITDAPTLRDGGRQKAALTGRFHALHDLLRELDPDEPPRPFPSAETELFQRIVGRESGDR